MDYVKFGNYLEQQPATLVVTCGSANSIRRILISELGRSFANAQDDIF